jgi:uncharacterized protein YndB with AHSA1/START domain
MMDIAETTTLADREILASRLFDAPRDLVWSAWTDVRHLEQWWGPFGFTTTTRRAQIKPGGEWRFVMHGLDGTDYENIITFLAVEAPARLAYTATRGRRDQDITFEVEIAFAAEETGRGSRCARFPSMRRVTVIEKYGARGDARTHRATARPPGAAGCFVITRSFEAPLDLVWRAHTEVEHLRQWWGPKGLPCTTPRRPAAWWNLPLRPAHAGGQEMWGRFVYREIIPQRRIVWVNSFSDARRPYASSASLDWPLGMLVMASFAAQGAGTTLTLRSAPSTRATTSAASSGGLQVDGRRLRRNTTSSPPCAPPGAESRSPRRIVFTSIAARGIAMRDWAGRTLPWRV